MEKRTREERECVFIRDIERERERESLHAKLRKRMGLFDGFASGTIARFLRRVSPNDHLMSHNVSMFAELPADRSSVHRSSYRTQSKKNKPVYTHARHWLSLAVLYAKIENGCTRSPLRTSAAAAAAAAVSLLCLSAISRRGRTNVSFGRGVCETRRWGDS